jgi:hypothetical protein
VRCHQSNVTYASLLPEDVILGRWFHWSSVHSLLLSCLCTHLLDFPSKYYMNSFSSMRATSPAHLTLLDFIPLLNNYSFLRPIKGDVEQKRLGSCRIPESACSSTYIWYLIETRVEELLPHIRLDHPNTSTVAELSTNLGHRIRLQTPVPSLPNSDNGL